MIQGPMEELPPYQDPNLNTELRGMLLRFAETTAPGAAEELAAQLEAGEYFLLMPVCDMDAAAGDFSFLTVTKELGGVVLYVFSHVTTMPVLEETEEVLALPWSALMKELPSMGINVLMIDDGSAHSLTAVLHDGTYSLIATQLLIRARKDPN